MTPIAARVAAAGDLLDLAAGLPPTNRVELLGKALDALEAARLLIADADLVEVSKLVAAEEHLVELHLESCAAHGGDALKIALACMHGSRGIC